LAETLSFTSREKASHLGDGTINGKLAYVNRESWEPEIWLKESFDQSIDHHFSFVHLESDSMEIAVTKC
jgi:hypothetical protein